MLSTSSEHYAWLLGDLRQVLRGDKKVCSYMQGRKGRNLEYLGVPVQPVRACGRTTLASSRSDPSPNAQLQSSLTHIEECRL